MRILLSLLNRNKYSMRKLLHHPRDRTYWGQRRRNLVTTGNNLVEFRAMYFANYQFGATPLHYLPDTNYYIAKFCFTICILNGVWLSLTIVCLQICCEEPLAITPKKAACLKWKGLNMYRSVMYWAVASRSMLLMEHSIIHRLSTPVSQPLKNTKPK